MKTIHVIVGPTASGKSALALERARAMNGAVINADSMQLYDALPILTAQPSAEDRAQAPHLLYGMLHPNAASSAGIWREMAVREIGALLLQGKTPVLCGGSGLYIKALLEGFSPIPNVPDDVRREVAALQARLGNPAFYERLKERDPVMAERLHPGHTARLVRAYEVIEATGRSLADFQAMPKQHPPEDWRFDITVLMPDKKALDERCERRFLQMMDNGAADEAAALRARRDIAPDALIRRALGLQPVLSWLDGEIGREEAIARAQADTRQYAKRQMTWFRHQIEPSVSIDRISIIQ